MAALQRTVAEHAARLDRCEATLRLLLAAIERPADLSQLQAGSLPTERLDALQAGLQTLLGLALEQQLERGAPPNAPQASGTSATDDESRS